MCERRNFPRKHSWSMSPNTIMESIALMHGYNPMIPGELNLGMVEAYIEEEQ